MILSTNTFQLFVDATDGTLVGFKTLPALIFSVFFREFFFKKTTLASVLNKLTDFKCTFSPDRYNWSPLAFSLPNFTVFTNPDSSSIIFQLISFTPNSVKAKSKVSDDEVSTVGFVGIDLYKRKFIFPPLSINLSKWYFEVAGSKAVKEVSVLFKSTFASTPVTSSKYFIETFLNFKLEILYLRGTPFVVSATILGSVLGIKASKM